MKNLKKIIISIDKNNYNLPAIITYETNTGSHTALKLDQESLETAKFFFQAIYKELTYIEDTYKIYCHDCNNNKIVLAQTIQQPKDHYLIGSDYESVERMIQKIKHITSLKKYLIPFYVTINGKTFYLNDRIIQIKKGIKDPKVLDIETYAMFIKELRPKLYENITKTHNKKNQDIVS